MGSARGAQEVVHRSGDGRASIVISCSMSGGEEGAVWPVRPEAQAQQALDVVSDQLVAGAEVAEASSSCVGGEVGCGSVRAASASIRFCSSWNDRSSGAREAVNRPAGGLAGLRPLCPADVSVEGLLGSCRCIVRWRAMMDSTASASGLLREWSVMFMCHSTS